MASSGKGRELNRLLRPMHRGCLQESLARNGLLSSRIRWNSEYSNNGNERRVLLGERRCENDQSQPDNVSEGPAKLSLAYTSGWDTALDGLGLVRILRSSNANYLQVTLKRNQGPSHASRENNDNRCRKRGCNLCSLVRRR